MKKLVFLILSLLLLQVSFAQYDDDKIYDNSNNNQTQTIININNGVQRGAVNVQTREFGVRMLQALDTDNPRAFNWNNKHRGYYYGTSDKMSTQSIACVERDVYTLDGDLYIAKGTPVNLDVRMKENRAPGIPAELRVRWISTTDISGNVVYLHGEFNQIGESKRGSAYGKAFGLGLTIMPGFGFLFLLIQGDEVVIPRNEYISNVTITPAPITYPED